MILTMVTLHLHITQIVALLTLIYIIHINNSNNM